MPACAGMTLERWKGRRLRSMVLAVVLRASCAKWGFQDLPFDPRRAMFVRVVDLKKNGIRA
jgi:hypothetical protein